MANQSAVELLTNAGTQPLAGEPQVKPPVKTETAAPSVFDILGSVQKQYDTVLVDNAKSLKQLNENFSNRRDGHISVINEDMDQMHADIERMEEVAKIPSFLRQLLSPWDPSFSVTHQKQKIAATQAKITLESNRLAMDRDITNDRRNVIKTSIDLAASRLKTFRDNIKDGLSIKSTQNVIREQDRSYMENVMKGLSSAQKEAAIAGYYKDLNDNGVIDNKRNDEMAPFIAFMESSLVDQRDKETKLAISQNKLLQEQMATGKQSKARRQEVAKNAISMYTFDQYDAMKNKSIAAGIGFIEQQISMKKNEKGVLVPDLERVSFQEAEKIFAETRKTSAETNAKIRAGKDAARRAFGTLQAVERSLQASAGVPNVGSTILQDKLRLANARLLSLTSQFRSQTHEAPSIDLTNSIGIASKEVEAIHDEFVTSTATGMSEDKEVQNAVAAYLRNPTGRMTSKHAEILGLLGLFDGSMPETSIFRNHMINQVSEGVKSTLEIPRASINSMNSTSMIAAALNGSRKKNALDQTIALQAEIAKIAPEAKANDRRQDVAHAILTYVRQANNPQLENLVMGKDGQFKSNFYTQGPSGPIFKMSEMFRVLAAVGLDAQASTLKDKMAAAHGNQKATEELLAESTQAKVPDIVNMIQQLYTDPKRRAAYTESSTGRENAGTAAFMQILYKGARTAFLESQTEKLAEQFTTHLEFLRKSQQILANEQYARALEQKTPDDQFAEISYTQVLFDPALRSRLEAMMVEEADKLIQGEKQALPENTTFSP